MATPYYYMELGTGEDGRPLFVGIPSGRSLAYRHAVRRKMIQEMKNRGLVLLPTNENFSRAYTAPPQKSTARTRRTMARRQARGV